MKIHHWACVLFLFVILAFTFFSHPPATKKEVEPVVPATTVEKQDSSPAATTVAPTTAEVNAAVTRVFGNLVVIDGDFVSADLNGDRSEDLVVPVTVVRGKLPQITDELANWSVQDILESNLPPPHVRTFTYTKRSRAHINQRDPLLAIIHGYGAAGWRNPEARQAYLLVHAAGGKLSTASIHDLEVLGMSLPRASLNPVLALVEKIDDRHRAIYWTGAQYAAAEASPHSALMAQN